MLLAKQNTLSLKGITLRGSIELFNPNENLASEQNIETPSTLDICIQPKRGIVMQQQIKMIKAWVKEEDREKVLQTDLAGKFLKVNSTMKTQYNRKMFEKLNLSGWNSAKESFETIKIQIVVSSQAKSIRSDIRYLATNSLNKVSNSRESGKQKKKEQFQVGQSYSYGREAVQFNRKKINEQLDRQLDFLFQSQNSRKQQYLPKYERGDYVQQLKRDSPNNQYKEKDVNDQPLNYNDTKIKKIYPQSNSLQNKNAQSQRFLQIIMLAALAGFFAALGSNFKYLFK